VLSVSAKRPHKNLVALLDALAAIPADTRPVLVLPGYPTWHEADLREHAGRLGVEDDVRFLGWVSADDLEGLYAMSECFVFPSLYEGFGLPVLEAMRRGVPVACSDRSSLPEVAGDAALLFDPDDPGAIRQAMERLLGDRALAGELARLGRARAEEFSWERSARETLASYERALAG
jgi:glycosyltransferase involved in cell wall biosynthesis